jgi:t-SNARE complex subunit (syntaxin)
MSSNFETTRNQLEENIEQARDTLGDLNAATDVAERKRLLNDARRFVGECRKNIQELDYLWNTLDSGDKGYYKSEITDFKQQFEMIRKDFTDYEKAIKIDDQDEESDELTKLQNETRAKLLGGMGKLSDQEKQLAGAVKDGHEPQNPKTPKPLLTCKY